MPSSGISMQKSSKGRYSAIKCKGPVVYSHHLLIILKYGI
jgi:hypothetical protein